jgi:hypothetical protein
VLLLKASQTLTTAPMMPTTAAARISAFPLSFLRSRRFISSPVVCVTEALAGLLVLFCRQEQRAVPARVTTSLVKLG